MDLHDHLHRYLNGYHDLRAQPPDLHDIQGYFRKLTRTRYVRRECEQIPVFLHGIRFDHAPGSVRGLFQRTTDVSAGTGSAGNHMRSNAFVPVGFPRILRYQEQLQDEAYEQDRSYRGNLRRILLRAYRRRHQYPLCYGSSGASDRLLLRYVFRLFKRLPYQCGQARI